MFERIGKGAQGILLAILVVLLGSVFLINFGPQSEGCKSGGSTGYAATVYGETISDADLRGAMAMAGFNRMSTSVVGQLRRKTLDGLIERELLVREARRLGMGATEEEVDDAIVAGRLHFSVPSTEATGFMWNETLRVDFSDDDGRFQYEQFQRWVQYGLRRSIAEFKEQQTAELLAFRMRQAIRAGVRVSEDEVWDDYVRREEQTGIRYMRFSKLWFRENLQPTSEEIDRWVTQNQAEVDREYTRQRFRYTGLEKQVRARHILIKAGEDATDEVREAARTRAQALLAQAREGADFAALARDNSEDTGSARRGGDLGYNPRGRMVEQFDQAMFSLAAGQITPELVQTRYGFHIIKVEGVREGDVPEQEAKREIAEGLYRNRRAEELAREQSTQALASLRDGQTLAQIEATIRERFAPPSRPRPATPDPAAADGGAPTADGGTPEPAAPPEEEDELRPRAEESEAFTRGGTPVPGLMEPAALVRAAFELTPEAPLPSEAIRAGDDFFVIQLNPELRKQAERAEFDRERDNLTAQFLSAKQRETLRQHIEALRSAAEATGDIVINETWLREQEQATEGGDEGEQASLRHGLSGALALLSEPRRRRRARGHTSA
ncbi:MAG: peptidylprolyl isomerase [Deltaproteobacteria bacterium]|nr:peptidylprolyl isomerase [Deltaproteobacteria bacterium]